MECECCKESFESWEIIEGYSICPICGYVNEELGLTFVNPDTSKTTTSTMTVNWDERVKKRAQVNPKTFVLPRRCVQILDALKIPRYSPFRDQVAVLAQSILTNPSFEAKRKLYQLFIYSCIYAVACKEGKKISLKDISRLASCDTFQLARVYGLVKKVLKFEENDPEDKAEKSCPLGPERLLERILSSISVGCGLENGASLGNTLGLSRFILQVSARYWINSGRNPLIISGSAILLASSATGFPATKENVAQACDCQKSVISKYEKEMKLALISFAKKVPHFSHLTLKNISKYLEELMKDDWLLKLVSNNPLDEEEILPPSLLKGLKTISERESLIDEAMSSSRSNNGKNETERLLWIRKLLSLTNFSKSDIVNRYWNHFPNIPPSKNNENHEFDDNELEQYLRSREEIEELSSFFYKNK